MSGTITTFRPLEFSEAPTDLITSLHTASTVVARIDELAVSDRELVDADVQAVAGEVTLPGAHSYTTLIDQSIAAHSTAVVHVQTGVTGATTDQRVLVDWPPLPAYLTVDAYVSDTDEVTIVGRNALVSGAVVLLAGTKISYLLLDA